MRESYRDKQSRKARINNEKREKDFQKKNNKRKFPSNEKRAEKLERPVREELKEEKVYDDVVAGRNAVMELLKSDKDINKIFIERGEKHGSINEIVARAKENKVVLVEVDKSKLDVMAENHQGVVAVVPPFNYCEIEDILQVAESKGEDPFILILYGIEDPHNL